MMRKLTLSVVTILMGILFYRVKKPTLSVDLQISSRQFSSQHNHLQQSFI